MFKRGKFVTFHIFTQVEKSTVYQWKQSCQCWEDIGSQWWVVNIGSIIGTISAHDWYDDCPNIGKRGSPIISCLLAQYRHVIGVTVVPILAKFRLPIIFLLLAQYRHVIGKTVVPTLAKFGLPIIFLLLAQYRHVIGITVVSILAKFR